MADAVDRAIAGADAGTGSIRSAIHALRDVVRSPATQPDGNADLDLLRCLHAVGRRDLPLGRLFEGHVDAQQIVARYAPAAVAEDVARRVHAGAALGVWNADLPGAPLRLDAGRLSGGKAYASGAGILSHALVTADTPDGRQLLLIDLAADAPEIDRSWWKTIGMQRSETHIVRWSDVAVDGEARIGQAGDYAREPWFSGGALRFVAVQAGGVAGLFDRVRAHLVAADRTGDPHQAARLAALYGQAELAAGAVRGAAAAWRHEPDTIRLPRVAAARLQVAELADRAIAIAQQAVGLQGLFDAHPLSAALTDLMVYLRQPAPDAQRMRVGKAAADGLLVPGL